MQQNYFSDPFNWPVLKHYEGEYLRRIALPVGGIGSGTISLGGRGNWQDWEIVNNPAKGFAPRNSFFAIRTETADKSTFVSALEGPISIHDYEGSSGCALPNHGLPHFQHAAFETAYPLGQVLLSDPASPVFVRLQAFNPLLPGDADASGFPVAVARFVVTNTTDEEIAVSLCSALENFIGTNGKEGEAKQNINEYRQGAEYAGLFGRSEGVASCDPRYGTLALAVLNDDLEISHRTSWEKSSWGNTLLDFWDDFSLDGKLEERERENQDAPMASLCAQFRLAPRATRAVTFLLGWHFPNRQIWMTGDAPAIECGSDCSSTIIGNYYTTQFDDAWDVLEKFIPRLPDLEAKTVSFVRAFCNSDLPESVREAALFNLSTLRSPTTFRTPDGKMFGWEGVNDCEGCCHGSCTHVWNYEQATAFLFGGLSRSIRDAEFLHATNEKGLMSFRIGLPLEKHARTWQLAAADGQMGCLLKLYRDWQLCGDDDWLRKLWPLAKTAMEFSWIPGGWDGDGDGVMEGCQHNTMDVEYYGPNPQMQGWYLGALRAMEEMASYLGDKDFAARCHELFVKGSRWMDEHLFNGDYYEQEIRPVTKMEDIAEGTRFAGSDARVLGEPDLQLGAGCLVDQLVGQYFAHLCGLGYLHDKGKVLLTLQGIMRHNFKEGFYGHFNQFRSYVLGDESAVLMATYPCGRRPQRPFPYSNEVMTGFEYTAAIGLLQEGQVADGLKIIEAIRERYDGRKRNPFNEAECGHHYARAMASWGAVLALSGFEYSAITQTMKFKRSENASKWFWSNGNAWGTIEQNVGNEFELRVENGSLALQTLQLGESCAARDAASPLKAGDIWRGKVA